MQQGTVSEGAHKHPQERELHLLVQFNFPLKFKNISSFLCEGFVFSVIYDCVLEFVDSRKEVFGDRSEAQRLNLIDHPDCSSQSKSIELFVSIENSNFSSE